MSLQEYFNYNINVSTSANTNFGATTIGSIFTPGPIFTPGSVTLYNNSNTLGNIVTTGGNVGIGITPSYKLHVNGSLFSTDISTGTLQAPNGITVGNINFTGSLYQNGIAYVGSQWTTTASNLSYTTGSVIVPNGITVGNINFTGSLFQNGLAYLGSQWTTTASNLSYTSGSVIVPSGITVGNINFTGSLYQNGVAYLGSQWTTTSGNTLTYTTGNVIIPNTMTVGTLNATTSISSASIQGTNSTITNSVHTALSTGTLNLSTITASSVLATTQVSSGALYSTNATSTNIVATAFSTGTLNLSTITAASVLATTQVSSGGLYSTNATSTNIVATAFSTGTATLSTITASSVLATTQVSSGALYSTNATSTNIVATAFSTGTATLSTITAASVLATTQVSSGALYSTNATSTNIVGTNISSSNIVVSTLTATTVASTLFAGANMSLSGNLNVAGTLTVVNVTSTNLLVSSGNAIINNITTGTLNATSLVSSANIAASIITTGTLNATTLTSSANITASIITTGTLNATTLTSSANIAASIITTGTLNATTLVSTANISTGFGTIANLLSTTATIPNMVHTNITTTSIIVTSGGLLATFNSNTIGNIFTTGGNVGIATTTPSTTLDVTGTARFTTSITTANVYSTNITSSNIVGTTNTLSNAVSTNITSATLQATTGITSAALLVTGLISNANLTSTTSTLPNAVSTNISSATLQASTGITSSALLVTGLISNANLASTTATIPNIIHTNITTNSIIVTSGGLNATFNSNTIGNIFTSGGNVGINTTAPGTTLDVSGTGRITTSLTTGALYSTNATSTNIVATALSSGTLTLSTITAASILATTSISSAALYSTNLTSTNIAGTNATFSSAIITNVSSSNMYTTILTSGNVYITDTTVAYGFSSAASIISAGGAAFRNMWLAGAAGSSTGSTPTQYTPLVLGWNSGNPQISFQRGDGSANTVYLGVNTQAQFAMINNSGVSSGGLLFQTGSARPIYFTGGNVGIGTSNPGYALDVVGTINATTYTGGSMNLSGNLNVAGTLTVVNVTSSNLVDTNITSTNLSVTNGFNFGGGVATSFAGSFSANNNVASATAITGLLFPTATIRSFIATMSINISKTGGNLNSQVIIEGVQTDSGWTIFDSYTGDNTTLVFAIDTNGNITYTSPSFTGWVSTTIRYEGKAYSISASYIPTLLPTSGNVSIAGPLSISSSTDATTTSSASVTITGGLGVSKSLLVGANLNVAGISTQFAGSFVAANNVSAATNITGFLLSNSVFGCFTAIVNVKLVTISSNLNAQYYIEGTQTNSGWIINDSSFGDATGITFTITSTGQIQYTSTNQTNWISTTINYTVTGVNLASGYTSNVPTSGNVTISGNLGITSTTDASTTSAASLTLSGGLGVAKSMLIGGNLNVAGISTQFGGTFSAANNVAIASAITGLLFPSATIRSFTVVISISVTATTNLNEQVTIEGIQTASGGWLINDYSVGEDASIVFSINSSGQLLYTSTNLAGWTATTMNYYAYAYNISGTYTPISIPTTGNIILPGTVTIQGTNIATTSSSGALVVGGGLSVNSNLYVANTLYTTGGNVGINTTRPSNMNDSTTSNETYILDVNGNARVQGSYQYGLEKVYTFNYQTTNTFTVSIPFAGDGNGMYNLTDLEVSVLGVSTNSSNPYQAKLKGIIRKYNASADIRVTEYSDFDGSSTTSPRIFATYSCTTSAYGTLIISIRPTTIAGGTLNNGVKIVLRGSTSTAIGAFGSYTIVDTGANTALSALSTGGGATPYNYSYINGLNYINASSISAGSATAYLSSIYTTSNSNTMGPIITTGGNVGIGTTAPSTALHISGGHLLATGNQTTRLIVQNSSTGTNLLLNGMQVVHDGNNGGFLCNYENNPMYFIVNGNNVRMTLNTSGNLGIGTTSPNNKLSISGTAAQVGIFPLTNGSEGSIAFYNNTQVSGDATRWNIGNNAASGVGNFGFWNSSLGRTALMMTSTGNVGIGTTAPSRSLHVAIGNMRLGGNNPVLDLGDDFTTQIYRNGTTSEMRLTTNSVDRITLTSNGNVGIGTNSPTYSLQVSQDNTGAYPGDNTTGQFVISGATDSTKRFGFQLDTTRNFGHIQVVKAGTSAYPLILNGIGGNVGIGTTAPTSTLTVAGSEITANGENSAITLQNTAATSGNKWYFRTGAVGTNTPIGGLSIADNNGYRMVLTSTGNVGIGTTSPAYTLDVNGTQRLFGANAYALILDGNSGNTGLHITYNSSNNYYMDFGIASATGSYSTSAVLGDGVIRVNSGRNLILQTTGTGASNMIIASSGNVGIGTASPAGMLHLNNAALFTSSGNLTCTGDIVSFGSLSDIRLKKNIETIDIQKSIDIVKNMRAVTFNWKEDIFNENKRNTSDIGFIAQEIEKLIPEAVSEYTEIKTGETYKNIKYERIIPHLLSTIQYLLDTVEELRLKN